jgi:transcriptional regulator with XRE-family HTH domain
VPICLILGKLIKRDGRLGLAPGDSRALPWAKNSLTPALLCILINLTVKQLRKKASLTQAQLAEAIGTSQAAVAHYEMGIKDPELAKLPAIAKALGVSVADLFKEEPGGSQASKMRVSPNRRAIKLQKAFEKLKPVE